MNFVDDDPLRDLRRQYLATLPRKFQDIRNLMTKLKGNRVDRETLDELWTVIHQIHGTAATFGLDEVGDIAMIWDELLYNLSENKIKEIGDREIAAMCAYFAQMQEVARAPINMSSEPV